MEPEKEKGDAAIITIDGPAGAGKSTVGKMLARKLNYMYLDTGAMYRAAALQAQREGIHPDDEVGLKELCRRLEIYFQESQEGQRVICQGEDVTEKIRDPQIGRIASTVSMMRPVREAMVHLQRKMGSRGKVVAEGRDTGTVVFPRAKYKFFLDADPNERARRRHAEFSAKGLAVPFEEIKRELRERDTQDSSRQLAPLRPAKDARIIDSTGLTPEAVLARMVRIIEEGAHSGERFSGHEEQKSKGFTADNAEDAEKN
jgi:cytidylate kinase